MPPIHQRPKSRLLAVFAALALLFATTVTWSSGVSIPAATDLAEWAEPADAELEAFEEHSASEDDAGSGEGGGDAVARHAAAPGLLRVRQPERVRARGPPTVLASARFRLTLAPRGPPFA